MSKARTSMLGIGLLAILGLYVGYGIFDLSRLEIEAGRVQTVQQTAAALPEMPAPRDLDRVVAVDAFLARPLFWVSRRVQEETSETDEAPVVSSVNFPTNVVLSGVVIDEQTRLALVLVDGKARRLAEGDELEAGWAVEKVTPDRVVFSSNSGKQELLLFEKIKVPSAAAARAVPASRGRARARPRPRPQPAVRAPVEEKAPSAPVVPAKPPEGSMPPPAGLGDLPSEIQEVFDASPFGQALGREPGPSEGGPAVPPVDFGDLPSEIPQEVFDASPFGKRMGRAPEPSEEDSR